MRRFFARAPGSQGCPIYFAKGIVVDFIVGSQLAGRRGPFVDGLLWPTFGEEGDKGPCEHVVFGYRATVRLVIVVASSSLNGTTGPDLIICLMRSCAALISALAESYFRDQGGFEELSKTIQRRWMRDNRPCIDAVLHERSWQAVSNLVFTPVAWYVTASSRLLRR